MNYSRNPPPDGGRCDAAEWPWSRTDGRPRRDPRPCPPSPWTRSALWCAGSAAPADDSRAEQRRIRNQNHGRTCWCNCVCV